MQGERKVGVINGPVSRGSRSGLKRQVLIRLKDEEMAALEELAAKAGRSVMGLARSVFLLGLEVARGDFYALAEKAGVELDVPEEDAAILGRKP